MLAWGSATAFFRNQHAMGHRGEVGQAVSKGIYEKQHLPSPDLAQGSGSGNVIEQSPLTGIHDILS